MRSAGKERHYRWREKTEAQRESRARKEDKGKREGARSYAFFLFVNLSVAFCSTLEFSFALSRSLSILQGSRTSTYGFP